MKRTTTKFYRRIIAVLGAVLMLFSCCGALAQTAAAKPVTRDQVPYLGSTSMEIGCTSREYSVTVYNASGPISVNKNGNSWITSYRVSGSRVYYTVSANNATTNRYGSLTITNNGYKMNLYITQYAPIFVRYNNASGNATSSITMDGATAYGASVRAILFINSAGTIRVSSNQSWLTLSLSGHYLTVTASANYTGGNRYATITVSNGKDTKAVSVTQKRYDPIYSNITYTNVPQPSAALRVAAAPFMDPNGWLAIRDNLYNYYYNSFVQQIGRPPINDYEVAVIQDYTAVDLIDNYYLPLYYTAASFMGVDAPKPFIHPMDPRPDGSPVAAFYDLATREMEVNLTMIYNDGPSTLMHTLHELHHVWQHNYAKYYGNLQQYVLKYNINFRQALNDNDYLEQDAYHYGETLYRYLAQ